MVPHFTPLRYTLVVFYPTNHCFATTPVHNSEKKILHTGVGVEYVATHSAIEVR